MGRADGRGGRGESGRSVIVDEPPATSATAEQEPARPDVAEKETPATTAAPESVEERPGNEPGRWSTEDAADGGPLRTAEQRRGELVIVLCTVTRVLGLHKTT